MRFQIILVIYVEMKCVLIVLKKLKKVGLAQNVVNYEQEKNKS